MYTMAWGGGAQYLRWTFKDKSYFRDLDTDAKLTLKHAE
jgi:hypothetical protein